MPARRGKFIVSEEALVAKRQHTAPCSDCPWSRKCVRGWTGPNDVATWIAAVHADERITCHTRKQPNGEHWQCAGAAIYRSNVSKNPRDKSLLLLPANTKLVFTWGEFERHHGE